MAGVKSNPFYQPENQWQIRIFIHRDLVPAIEEAMMDMALSLSSFEISEENAEWYVDAITDNQPENKEVTTTLSLVSGLLNIPTPRFEISPLERKDWINEVEQSFPPLNIARFYVYGSHIKSPIPYSKIALKINAGAAFGSGEHSTTSGCLVALSLLAKKRDFGKVLDMGCGSGILAIAAAKLWHPYVIGADIDPVSVKTAHENSILNQVNRYTRFTGGDGYNSNFVRKNAPYDLIIANILARPLMKMSPSLAKNLKKGGIAILSGLLARQEKMVLAAHRKHGLRLIARICNNGWNTLILGN